MTIHKLTIPGNPRPKQRARSGNGHHYTPECTRQAENLIRLFAKKQRIPCLPGMVRLSVTFARKDAQPCDLDNLTKLVQDALNGIAYHDDRQIVALSAVKFIDREKPRTEIAIEEVEPAVEDEEARR